VELPSTLDNILSRSWRLAGMYCAKYLSRAVKALDAEITPSKVLARRHQRGNILLIKNV
jgi:hypothetical protein